MELPRTNNYEFMFPYNVTSARLWTSTNIQVNVVMSLYDLIMNLLLDYEIYVFCFNP